MNYLKANWRLWNPCPILICRPAGDVQQWTTDISPLAFFFSGENFKSRLLPPCHAMHNAPELWPQRRKNMKKDQSVFFISVSIPKLKISFNNLDQRPLPVILWFLKLLKTNRQKHEVKYDPHLAGPVWSHFRVFHSSLSHIVLKWSRVEISISKKRPRGTVRHSDPLGRS